MGTPTGRCEVDVGVSEVKMKHGGAALITGWGLTQGPTHVHNSFCTGRLQGVLLHIYKSIFSFYIKFLTFAEVLRWKQHKL